MISLSGPRTAVTVVLLIARVAGCFAQTPGEERWLSFMEWNRGESRLPEDETMGLLADRRNPDPFWSSALLVCDRAFSSIRKGEVPVNQIHPSVLVPLSLAFEGVLNDGGKNVYPRYALPGREDGRITVPIRLTGEEQVSYGYIYLSRWDGEWFIDQWAIDLSEYPDNQTEDE